jgi:hypothetical protein
MQLLERPPQPTRVRENADALIKEARRLRRRRWALGTLRAAGLLGVGTSVVALAMSSSSAPTAAGPGASAGVLPNGRLATLQVAGPMAVGSDGALYIADDQTTDGRDDRVLVRLPDGRFRVIAGTGKRGFSGDGGPAVRAELSDVTDLAVGPDGTLYIADGSRVRAVSRDGVIRTIAGDGHPARIIANGAPALRAALGTRLSIALSAAGRLYISSSSPWGSPLPQILRLTRAGTLDPVRAVVTSATGGNLADHMAIGKQLTGFGQIAVDGRGDIDVAGGPGGYGVWQITLNGEARLVSGDRYADGNGGADPTLERGPAGAVFVAVGTGISRIGAGKLVPIATFDTPLSSPLRSGQLFQPLYFAVNRNGTLYADDNGPIG